MAKNKTIKKSLNFLFIEAGTCACQYRQIKVIVYWVINLVLILSVQEEATHLYMPGTSSKCRTVTLVREGAKKVLF